MTIIHNVVSIDILNKMSMVVSNANSNNYTFNNLKNGTFAVVSAKMVLNLQNQVFIFLLA